MSKVAGGSEPNRDRRDRTSRAGTNEAALGGASGPAPRLRYARWRALSLVSVYALIALHIAHWRITGRTLAPLELNEVLYTLELGIVTAGFLFMAFALVSVVVFGRFFCSWGCHILALEDLAAWLLKKIGVRPKPIRSRVLLWVPPLAMAYMFLWPQMLRLMEGRPLPSLKIFSDTQGWASFITTNFWRNLPGPGVIALTFGVCGFAIVYFLGTRSFCTYACPYGVVFGVADRFAPGRITASGDCSKCGLCTSVCQSRVRVQEEARMFGMIVDPSCLKDLDCVSVCPTGALRYRFTHPSGFSSLRREGRRVIPYDFTLGEDALMAGVFIATLFIFRGLYGLVPFLMTLGLGGILGYGAVLVLRLVTRRDVRLNNFQLKRAGSMTLAGQTYAALALGGLVVSAHSGLIHYHQWAGMRAYDAIAGPLERKEPVGAAERSAALGHLGFCDRWGLVKPKEQDRRLAELYVAGETPARAEPYIRRYLASEPGDDEWRVTLAAVMLTENRVDEAVQELLTVTKDEAIDPGAGSRPRLIHASANEMLGSIRSLQGDSPGALVHFRKALEENPESPIAAEAVAGAARDTATALTR